MSQSILKNAVFVFACQGIGMVLLFSRNVLLARMLPVEDMAIVALIGLTIGVVELFGEIGLAKFSMQATAQDEDDTLACVHAISVSRGVAYSVLLFLLSGSWAALLGVPEQGWLFSATAIIPLVRGFSHYDVYLQQRDLSFHASNWMELVSQVTAFVSAVIFATIFRSFVAGYLAVAIYTIAFTISSHVIARRKYQVRWINAVAKRAIRFGMPLLADCILIGLIINSDRFLVAISSSISQEYQFTLSEVSVYCLAFGLCYAFALLLVRAGSTVFHPWLLKARSDKALFDRRMLEITDITVALAVFIVVLLGVCGRTIFEWVYGDRYVLPSGLLETMSLIYAVRFLRMIPEVVAFAQGRNQEILYMNSVRFLGISGIPLAIAGGHGLVGVALSCLLAEMLACGFAFFRLAYHRMPERFLLVLVRLLFGGAVAGLAVMFRVLFLSNATVAELTVLGTTAVLLTVSSLPACRSVVWILCKKATATAGFAQR